MRPVRFVARFDDAVEDDESLTGRGTDRLEDPPRRVVVPVVEDRREQMRVAAAMGRAPSPDPAVLGMLIVGRITDRPWAVDGRLALRKVVHLSLTFDHRVCDGGTAAGFLRHVAERIQG